MNTEKICSMSSSLSRQDKCYAYYLSSSMQQVSYSDFDEEDRELVKELCDVIAKTMLLKNNYSVRINGEYHSAGEIKEVFNTLREKHIYHVIENFRNQSHKIKYPYTYLRTALYNPTSETEHKIENKVAEWLK